MPDSRLRSSRIPGVVVSSRGLAPGWFHHPGGHESPTSAYYGVARAGQAGQPVTLPPSAVRLHARNCQVHEGAGRVTRRGWSSCSLRAAARQMCRLRKRELANSRANFPAILDEGWEAVPGSARRGVRTRPSAFCRCHPEEGLGQVPTGRERIRSTRRCEEPRRWRFQQTHALLQQLYAHQSPSSPARALAATARSQLMSVLLARDSTTLLPPA